MALGNLKQGRGAGHFSPMQLLVEVGAGYSWAKDVFCEYFRCTRGIHSLYWSKYLKSFFGIGEVSDDQIANGAADSNLQRFLDFPCDYFRRLSVDHKAALRKYAAFNQWNEACTLLDELNIIYICCHDKYICHTFTSKFKKMVSSHFERIQMFTVSGCAFLFNPHQNPCKGHF